MSSELQIIGAMQGSLRQSRFLPPHGEKPHFFKVMQVDWVRARENQGPPGLHPFSEDRSHLYQGGV